MAKEMVQPADTCGMAAPHGRQLEHLPVDQLDAVVRFEDVSLGHTVVILHREAMGRGAESHLARVANVAP